MTRTDHEAAVLAAHYRFADALQALDEYRKREEQLVEAMRSAEGELRALARRKA